MLKEVEMYGEVLNVTGTISATDLLTNDKNFDAADVAKRPPGWLDLRLKRVLLREFIDRSQGKSDLAIFEARAQKFLAVSR
jgi:hypothetical protein